MKTYSNYVIVGFVSLFIAIIVGICIVAIIDKKLSDITINVPKPEVTVNMSKCESDKLENFETTKTDSHTPSSGTPDSRTPSSGTPDSNQNQSEIIDKTESKKTDSKKSETVKKIKVNPDWLDKILDTEQYDDVEGYKQYAVMGCPDRRKKMKLYPNIVACNQPNYLTAENYYNANFNYPYIPGQSEERWMPADYEYTTFLSPADKSIRIITRNKSKLSTKQPFPSNYWFK